MTGKKIYLTVQTVLCLVICIWLAASAVGLYAEGHLSPSAENGVQEGFTRDKVVRQLTQLLPLIAVSFCMTAAGLLLGLRDERQFLPVRDAEIARNLLAGKVASPSPAMQAEVVRRKRIRITGRAGAAACMIPVLLYLSRGSHFENPDLEAVMGSLVLHILPWLVIAFGIPAITELLRERSFQREADAAKVQLKSERASGQQHTSDNAFFSRPSRNLCGVRIALFLFAAFLILHGIFNGSMRDVLIKAIAICTECIGLG